MPFDDGGNSKSPVSPEPNFLSETRVWVGSMIFCLTVAAIIIIVVLLCFASFFCLFLFVFCFFYFFVFLGTFLTKAVERSK